MSIDFSDKKFRPSYTTELKRLSAAIKACDDLDTQLTETCNELRKSMRQNKGAANLLVRMTEQQISNRNQRLALIKELKAFKKDSADREIKLAEKTIDVSSIATVSGITHALLDKLQDIILTPGFTSNMLEPELPAKEEVEEEVEPIAESDEELDFTNIKIGDIVSDSNGQLWILNEDGAEELPETIKDIFNSTDGSYSYGIMNDGRRVLVVDIDTSDVDDETPTE